MTGREQEGSQDRHRQGLAERLGGGEFRDEEISGIYIQPPSCHLALLAAWEGPMGLSQRG